MYIKSRWGYNLAYIEEQKLKEIRENVDIVDVISRYISLNKRGKNHFGICPFHDDNEPSLSVSSEKQIFKCFSCGASGNVFTFLMDYEHLSFLESVKKISTLAGINVDIDTKPTNPQEKVFLEIYEQAQKLYRNNIVAKEGAKALKYLKNRGLDEETINYFEIGLALNKQPVGEYLQAKKFAPKDLENCGLINENGYDIFQDRIMFPIHNSNGRLVAYSGRLFEERDDSKYINTKETIIFKKSEVLYNYHRVRDMMRQEKELILLEGYMDVISLYQQGIKNTVASMGTAFTIQQARLIKKLTNQVIILYDGDEAGERATLATIEELRKVGIIPKVVRLHDNLDPEDYIKENGVEALQELLTQPLNIIDFYREYYKKNKDLQDDTQLAEYVNKILVEINKIEDKVLKELALKKLSEEADIEINFLRKQIKGREITKKPTVKPKKHENKYTLAEKHLIFYMLKSPEVIKIYRRRVTFMPTYECRLLAIEISEFFDKYQNINVADIFTLISHKEKLVNKLKEILQENLNEDFKMEQIEDYINVINEYNHKYELEQLKQEMKKETNVNKKIEIAEKIRKIQMGDE